MNDFPAPPPAELTEAELPEVELAETSAEPVVEPVAEALAEVTENQASKGPVEDVETSATDEPVKPRPKTVRQDYPIDESLSGPWDYDQPYLPLPGQRLDELNDIVKTHANVDPTTTENGARWAEYLRLARQFEPVNKLWVGRVDREGSEFVQSIEGADRRPLCAGQPKFAAPSGSRLTGPEAVLRVRHVLGVGSIIQFPCWSSGFWITVRAPAEADLIALEERISNEKIVLGRATQGAIFSNMSVFMALHVMNFVEQHIYDTTLVDRSDIASKLTIHDLQTIAWGMAMAIYPNGFQYARSILVPKGEGMAAEARLIQRKLRLSKLLWPDYSVLSEWQIKHMSERRGSKMTNEMLDRYKSEFKFSENREIELVEGCLWSTLKLPTVSEFIQSGTNWVNGITVAAIDALGVAPDNQEINYKERNEAIMNRAKAEHLMQYVHFIKSLRLPGDDVIEDRETIANTLSEIGAADGVSDVIYREVSQFIEDTTVSVIATTTVDETEENLYPRYPLLLPIDAVATFFILHKQKVQQILAR